MSRRVVERSQDGGDNPPTFTERRLGVVGLPATMPAGLPRGPDAGLAGRERAGERLTGSYQFEEPDFLVVPLPGRG